MNMYSHAVNPLFSEFADKTFLTPFQVAKCLGVSRSTVLHWERAGYLPLAARIGPQKQRRFHRDEIIEFMKQQDL